MLSNAYPIPNIRPLNSPSCYRVIPETIGQFTGLYDSTKWEDLSKAEQEEWLINHTVNKWHGKQIFEGDILRYGDTNFKVVFKQSYSAAYFGLAYSSIEIISFDDYFNLECAKVVGNLHVIYSDPM